jgi:hypothetical protein
MCLPEHLQIRYSPAIHQLVRALSRKEHIMKEIYKHRPKRVQMPRVWYTLALPVRAESVAHSPRVLNEVFRHVLSDEDFVMLLRPVMSVQMLGVPQPLVYKQQEAVFTIQPPDIRPQAASTGVALKIKLG